jgi:hypothetical protein
VFQAAVAPLLALLLLLLQQALLVALAPWAGPV